MSARVQRIEVDGVNYSPDEIRVAVRRRDELEEQIRAWRNAFPMFAYHVTKHCIMRDDFSGEPPEADGR